MQVIVYVKICRFKERKKLSRVDEKFEYLFRMEAHAKKNPTKIYWEFYVGRLSISG